MNPRYTLREIAQRVGGTVVSGEDVGISGIARLEQVEPGQLTYVTAKRYLRQAENSRAAALLVPPGLKPVKPAIEVGAPLLAYAQLLAWFHPAPIPRAGIQPGAWVDEHARVSPRATIMPTAYVGPQAQVGAGCVIHAGAVVGASAQVGEGCTLHPHVTLYEGVRIGRNVIIHAGSVIGSDGFGYVADDEGRHVKIPQIGSVVIEDDVEIGANVCIDRATQGVTRIGQGTKIDNHVQVGHNVTVGPHSILVAQVGVSGSCHIGRHVVLAGQVGVRDHVTIGDGAMVAGGSGVVRDLAPGARVAGLPAMPHMEWLRVQALTAKLPDWQRRIHDFERRLHELERRGGNREASRPS